MSTADKKTAGRTPADLVAQKQRWYVSADGPTRAAPTRRAGPARSEPVVSRSKLCRQLEQLTVHCQRAHMLRCGLHAAARCRRCQLHSRARRSCGRSGNGNAACSDLATALFDDDAVDRRIAHGLLTLRGRARLPHRVRRAAINRTTPAHCGISAAMASHRPNQPDTSSDLRCAGYARDAASKWWRDRRCWSAR